jgi:endonuclease YncB( thermonuclease family)
MWLIPIPDASAAEVIHAVVKSVYDGDTVTLSDGTKVRLAHVNTPELRPAEPWAAEARDAAAALVLGREVEVLTDGTRDRYGRLVASLRVGGVDLGTQLVEQGLGHVFVVPPEGGDVSALLVSQAAARAAKRGMWSNRESPLAITSFHANGGRDVTDPNAEYFRLCNVADEAIDLTGWTVSDPAGRRFALPAVALPPGYAVAVHSGIGSDDVASGRLYLDSPLPIWPDEGARIILLDPGGAERGTRTP